MAYEARSQFKDKRVFLSNDIVHNPVVSRHWKMHILEMHSKCRSTVSHIWCIWSKVNERLAELGIIFVPHRGLKKDFDEVQKDDVVIISAHGVTIEELKELDAKWVGAEAVIHQGTS